jgi:hypothetical protein
MRIAKEHYAGIAVGTLLFKLGFLKLKPQIPAFFVVRCGFSA